MKILLLLAVVAVMSVNGDRLRASIGMGLLNLRSWLKGDYKRYRMENKNVRTEGGGAPTCGAFTRDSVVNCANKLADLNCDNALQLNELETFKSDHFTWYEKGISAVFISPSDIMLHCDTNHDGKITNAEFYSNYQECLVNEDEMCHARTICERELQSSYPNFVCGRS
jgi:hypothetical protein